MGEKNGLLFWVEIWVLEEEVNRRRRWSRRRGRDVAFFFYVFIIN